MSNMTLSEKIDRLIQEAQEQRFENEYKEREYRQDRTAAHDKHHHEEQERNRQRVLDKMKTDKALKANKTTRN